VDVAFDSDDQAIIDALTHTWRSIRWVLSDLPAEAWDQQSILPGWDIHAIVAHLVGFEHQWFLGKKPYADPINPWPSHVTNDLAADNERWVFDWSETHSSELLEAFDEMVEARTKQLLAARFYPQGFDTPVLTFRGDERMRDALRTRLFDIALHEQDLRWSLGRPGNLDGPGVGYVRSQMISALGYVAGKSASLPDGTVVAVTIYGSHQQTIAVAVQNGRGMLVPLAQNRAACAVTMHDEVFLQVTTGRRSAPEALVTEDIKIRGDLETARRFAVCLQVHSL
jgi:uncharacterized protein (TIGR03083 family)